MESQVPMKPAHEYIRAQDLFSLSHHLGREQSLPWKRTQTQRKSVAHEYERDVQATMPRSGAASSADVGRLTEMLT